MIQPFQRANWLRRSVGAMFGATLLVSHKLWLSTRDYPLTPLWKGLPQPPFPFDYVLLGLMLIALLGATVLRKPRWCLWLVCGIGILWAVLDQSRWQPYFVHYMILIACFLLVRWESRGQGGMAELGWAMMPARLLLAFTYFHSGLQKLNLHFGIWVIPWITTPLKSWFGINTSNFPERALLTMGIPLALAEASAGLLLLVPRTRRLAVLFLVSMHTFILLMIGPWARNTNQVIWPWNIAMMIALWCLFWQRGDEVDSLPQFFSLAWWRSVMRLRASGSTQDLGVKHSLLIGSIIILFGALPAFSYFGFWDSYLSFSLYSGNLREAAIKVDPADSQSLPPSARAILRPDGIVNLNSWSLSELRATLYPEDRIALNIGQVLARRGVQQPVLVAIKEKPHPLTGERVVKIFLCPPGGTAPSFIRQQTVPAERFVPDQ